MTGSPIRRTRTLVTTPPTGRRSHRPDPRVLRWPTRARTRVLTGATDRRNRDRGSEHRSRSRSPPWPGLISPGPELPAEAGSVMNLSYDVFVNDPPPQDGFLPNGEPKRFSPDGQHADLRARGRGPDRPGDDRGSGGCAGRLGRRQAPEPHRHLRYPRPRRSLVRRRAPGRTVRRPCRRHRGHHRPDARQPWRRGRCCGTSCTGDPAVIGHRGDGPGQPLHARGPRPGDRRGRPRRRDDNTVLHVPDLGLVVAGD